MSSARTVPAEADVLVVGGGLAGLAAAIAAAATGANTLLLERGSVLGGNATQAYVHSFCGLFEPPKEGRLIYANPGFTPWFAEGLRRYGGALAPEIHGRVGVMPIFPPRLAEFAQTIIARFSSLSVALNCRLTGLNLISPTSVSEPVLAEYSGLDGERTVRAKVVIDTSGDATAGHLAGAASEAPDRDELQHATLIFRVRGADQSALMGYSRLKLSAVIARGASRGELPADCDSVLVRPGEQPDEAYISLNLPKWSERRYAPLDEAFMQEYSRYAHGLAEALIDFLRTSLPEWSKLQLLAWPHSIGVRESRHLLGCYVMQETDILEAVKFSDAVARSSWPIELWRGHKGADFKYPNGVADIPLRALISQSHANLGMAGRCVSGSHEALGALRVLGTAMATGEAIGLTAALAADTNRSLTQVSATEVHSIRDRLMERFFRQP